MTIKREDVEEAVSTIVKIHERIIDASGGFHGARDEGGLYHAVFEVLSSLEKFSDNPFKAAAKIYKLFATRHYFVDGNKRTAHILSKLSLFDHGYIFRPGYKESISFIIAIGSGKKSLNEIEEWIKANSSKRQK